MHSSFCFGVERQDGGSGSGDHVFLLGPVRLAVRRARPPVKYNKRFYFLFKVFWRILGPFVGSQIPVLD